MDLTLFEEVMEQLKNLPDINQDALNVIETAASKGKFQASFAALDDNTIDQIACWSPFTITPLVPYAPKKIKFIISWYGVRDWSSSDMV